MGSRRRVCNLDDELTITYLERPVERSGWNIMWLLPG